MTKPKRPLHVGLSFRGTDTVREQLLREITNLERQLEHLEMGEAGAGVDFSMLQTYKELIQCRRGMLNELPRNL